MRDIALILLFCVALPACLFRPIVGVLLWALFGYLNPHRLTWGIAYDFPFAQIIAVATVGGLLFQYIQGWRPAHHPWVRETYLLLLLWVLFIVTTFFAIVPGVPWIKLTDLSKILLMGFITIFLVDDRKKLRWLVMVIGLSIGFYGLKGGVFSILRGGESMVFGPPRSFLEDNTSLGVALNMALPILYYLGRFESNVKLKLMFYGFAGFTFISILFTYSRGAALGLAAVMGVMFLRFSMRFKLVSFAILVLASPVIIASIPSEWFDRIETISTYEEDGSAMKRIRAWETAFAVAKARPLTGAGFQIIDEVEIAGAYNPEFTVQDIGVHSIYFEVMAENGFVTFFVFMTLMGCCFFASRRLAASNSDLRQYGLMLEASFVGYAVSGAFLELAGFDLFYHLVGILIVCKTLEAQGETVAHSEPGGANRPAHRAGWVRVP